MVLVLGWWKRSMLQIVKDLFYSKCWENDTRIAWMLAQSAHSSPKSSLVRSKKRVFGSWHTHHAFRLQHLVDLFRGAVPYGHIDITRSNLHSRAVSMFSIYANGVKERWGRGSRFQIDRSRLNQSSSTDIADGTGLGSLFVGMIAVFSFCCWCCIE